MVPDNIKSAYPVLVATARELSTTIKEKRSVRWISHEDLSKKLQDVGIKETARSIGAKLLKPLQTACLEAGLPDLSSIIVRPSKKGDFGPLVSPAPAWWEPYIARGECQGEDVNFWFNKFREARDYEDWPDTFPES